MVDRTDSHKQIDDDILKCRADVLRASDAIPPYGKVPPQEQKLQKPQTTERKSLLPQNSQKQSLQDIIPPFGEKRITPSKSISIKEEIAPADDDTVIMSVEAIHTKDVPPPPIPTESINKKETTGATPEQSDIPRFDLANDIMAEYRKTTATKRKSPGKKTEQQIQNQPIEPIRSTTKKTPALSERIISEIVRKDIERLYRDDISGI